LQNAHALQQDERPLPRPASWAWIRRSMPRARHHR